MSLMNGNGGLSAADIAAVMGNSGNGYGFGGDGAWWLVIIMLFALTGGNWGGCGNNSGNGFIASDVQRGFDQTALMSSLNGLTTAVSNGFANAEVSRCNTQANLTNLLNSISMQQQNCCCENRAAVADLKYTVATENCQDRAALNDGVQAIINSISQNVGSVMDKICQLELDAKNDKIADLQNQLTMATLRESQAGQTARILADNAAQTATLENYLNPPAIPAYIVQNPNCCQTAPYYANGCRRA